MFKNFNKTIKTKIVSTLFLEIIYVSTIPFISFYLLDFLNQKTTGLILTASVIISLIFSLIGGYIGNHYNKKFLIIFFQLFMALTLFIMFLSLINKLILLFITSFIFFNIGWGLQYPILSSYIMDVITDDEDSIYSFIYWITNLGVAIGSLLGSFAYLYFKNYLLIIATIVFSAISLMYYLGFENIEKKENIKINKNFFKQYLTAFKRTKVIKLIFGGLLLNFGELTLYSYIAIKLKEQFKPFNLGIATINGIQMYSIILFINTVIIIFFTFLITKLFSKFSIKFSILTSITIYILGYTYASFSNNFYVLILCISLATIGEIIYAPSYNVAKYNIVPENERNIFEAIDNVLFYITDSFAKYMIVLSLSLNNFFNSFIIFAVMLIGGILFYLNMFKNK